MVASAVSLVIGVAWGLHGERDPGFVSRDLATLLRWWETGQLKPRIAQVFPLTEIAAAMRALLSRRLAGKVVLKI